MFKIRSLFHRTFLLIVTSLITLVAFFSYLSITNQSHALLNVLHSEARTVAKSIALVSSDSMVIEDYSFIVQHNEKVIQNNDGIVYILVAKKSKDGVVIYNHQDGWEIMEKLPKELSSMHNSNENSKIFETVLSSYHDIYHFSYPVIFSGVEWGWISIGFSLQAYNQHMKTAYIQNFYLLLATIVASFLFSFLLARWLIKPILLLNKAAKKVSKGDFNAEVKLTSNDEIQELANSFNEMLNTIKSSNKTMTMYNEELENRVNERTQELNTLNKELDQRVKSEVLKRAQQEQILIQQSRFAAMGEMIGNIAHQWRQPLNALSLLLQNIENAYEMEILTQEYITRSIAKGNRLTDSMSQTIDDFRNFFKPNKRHELFTIESSLNSTMDLLKSSLQNNTIEVSKEIDSSVLINGFASEFAQVLLNIINNARDALIENVTTDRTLYLKVFKDEKYAYVEIEDNAGGIPDEIINKIFDPYFTTKEEGKGTGIGLYMSKTIIENSMNGGLKVENSNIGAKFTIRLELRDN